MPLRRGELLAQLAKLIIFCALLPAVAGAQPLDLDTPVDSPLWWTLTDEVSPQQLREAYRDPEANRQRFREAVAAGLQPPAPKDPDLRYLDFYLQPRLNPELVPMWYAFASLSRNWLPQEGRAAIASALAARGISAGGIERVLAVAAESAARLQRRYDEIGPLSRDFGRIRWAILDHNGWSEESKREVEAAVARDDASYFAERSGRSETEVASMLAATKDDFYYRVPAEGTVQLNEELDPADWRGLRRYLFDRAASDLANLMDSSG